MNLPFSNKKTSASKGCLLTIAIVVALILAVGLGRQLYGSVSPAMLLLIVVAVGFVIIYLLNQRTKNFSAEIDSLKEKRAELIKIGTKYNELRDIYLKKMELQSAKTVSQAVVTLTANTAGTNPITDVRFTSSDKAQANTVYDYGTDASTTQGLKLTTDGTPFVSYCAPITGMGSHLKLICTYDVYNRKGTKVRENCVAENSLADLSGLTIERGKKSVINLTVEPTYLYQLSEDELDNPGIKISVSGN